MRNEKHFGHSNNRPPQSQPVARPSGTAELARHLHEVFLQVQRDATDLTIPEAERPQTYAPKKESQWGTSNLHKQPPFNFLAALKEALKSDGKGPP
eukprot:jgi/Botrbrau1/16007/Bobra.0353s0005.1